MKSGIFQFLHQKYLLLLSLFVFVCLTIGSGEASAASFYVRTDGNDINTGLENSPSGAFRTIQHAANSATAGDVIEVQEGVYNEALVINSAATPDKRITFKGMGKVVLDGQNALQTAVFTGETAGNVDFVNLEIRNYTQFAFYFDSYDNRIENCDIHDNAMVMEGHGTGIGFGGQVFKNTKFYNHSAPSGYVIRPYYAAKGLTFEDCDFHDNKGTVIWWAHTQGSNYIIRCRFYNNPGAAVTSGDLIGTAYVYNSVFYNNGTAFGSGDDRYGSVKVLKNNIFANNRYGIAKYTYDYGTVTSDHNDVWNNDTNYSNVAAGAHDISQDPMFVSPKTADFHVKPFSPAVNAGIDLGYPYNGTAPDMGTYETYVNKIYYVRTDGNDANSGLENSALGAFRTIQHAANSATAGDIIEVQEGVYNEALTIYSPSTPDKRIIIKGVGKAVLDGQNTLQTAIFTGEAAGNVDFVNLEIRNYTQFAFYFDSYDNRIEDCDIHDNAMAMEGHGTGIGFGGQHFKNTRFYNHTAPSGYVIRPYYADKGLTFEDCEFYNNKGTVIWWAHTQGSNYIIRCRFYNNPGAAVTSGDLIGAEYIYNSVFYNNGTAFASGDDRSGSVKVLKNNIFANNSVGIGKYTYDYGKVTSDYNNVWNNGTNYSNVAAGANDISQDPLFVSPTAADFHLQAFSPCLEKGLDLGYAFYGAAPDLGAFEKTHSSTVATLSGTAVGNGWYSSDVTVDITDDLPAALQEIRYEIDKGGEATQPTSPASFILTADGSHSVTFYAVDKDGAAEPVNSVTVNIDKAPPVTTATLQGTMGSNGSYTTVVTVNLSGADAGSGVKEIHYSINDGAEVVIAGPLASTKLTTNGTHTITYYAIDKAGFREAAKTRTIQINGTVDLTATAISGPATANTGKTVTVNTTVTNIGPTAASSFYVHAYISSSSGANVQIGSTYVNGLAAGATQSLAITGNIPSTTAHGTYTYKIVVDTFNYVVEAIENNNTLNGNQVAVSGSDLTATAVSGPATANTGKPVTVNASIANTGSGDASSFYVHAYITSGSGANVQIGSTYVNGLAAGATQSLAITGNIPSTTAHGTYTYKIVVDTFNYVVEAIENNNTLNGNQVAVSGSDLTATAVSGPATANTGKPVTVNASIANTGSGDASSFYVHAYITSGSGANVQIGSTYVNGLAAGATQSLAITGNIPSTTAHGTYTYKIVVDTFNYVTEANENNNTLTGNQVAVSGSDLTATAVSGPATANTGKPVTVNASIANTGSGDASSFYVHAYITSGSGANVQIGSTYVNGLAAGATQSLAITGNIPSTTAHGTYTYKIVVDTFNYVTEANENNNTLTGNQVAVSGSDLTATAVSGPATANTGKPVTVNASIANTGSGDASSFYVHAYITSGSGANVQIGSTYVNGLAAGATQSLAITGNIPSTTAHGTYTYKIVVDTFNYVVEANENNNTLTGNQVAVSGSDLSATAVSGPATASIGQSFSLNTTIANTGSGDASSFYVHAYITSSSGANIQIGSTYVSSLQAGATQSLAIPVTIPSNIAPGTYTYKVIVDTFNYVTEANENNNTLTGNQVAI
ncbi:disaggregatase, CARDB domain repeat-containing [Geotalea daltonii FRC-32]|uniref:Disaggregatase, CARDB domain repeat-containing n=1 Tax=Geotalea daltonii (strain DSM 22248 / JCM 15807 / FRC-32) TaxID=316067 RepID=B9M1U2_GEODF|nr:CARDB domain-containing protein [Geotalea daltonii]ACM19238.1 disaggregatase, CARDB domain repeat-containing [Geotalea daltonii FRC-32]